MGLLPVDFESTVSTIPPLRRQVLLKKRDPEEHFWVLCTVRQANHNHVFLIFRQIPHLPPERIALSDEELLHLKVRRLRPGDSLYVGDSVYRRWEGHLSEKSDALIVAPHATAMEQAEPHRILFTAVPQGKRWDWLLQKAVELGVTHIIPVQFQRSERYRESIQRENRILLEAASQSRRFFLPQIHGALLWDEISNHELWQKAGQRYLLHQHSSASIDHHLKKLDPIQWGNLALVVGPEGGLTDEEREFLLSREAEAISLGPHILRVETAALAALALFLSLHKE